MAWKNNIVVLALGLLSSARLLAAGLDLSVEVPRLKVAEYHRPYVAVWIEKPDATLAANLSVWYQLERASGAAKAAPEEKDGSKWLKDLRQWWRRSGRTQQLPMDAVSGPTRPEGLHTLHFTDSAKPLQGLAAGNYRLVVEAARENGGRELLKIDFSWPPSAGLHLNAQGKTELGAVKLDLNP